MAKKKTRKPGRAVPRPWLFRGLGIAFLLLLAGSLLWWIGAQSRTYAAFQEAARRGQPALSRVEIFPEEGRVHLAPGERAPYRTDPPTSGPHSPESVPLVSTPRNSLPSAWSTP